MAANETLVSPNSESETQCHAVLRVHMFCLACFRL